RPTETGTLRDALYAWLARTPVDGSNDEAHVARYLSAFIGAHEQGLERRLAAARAEVARTEEDVAILERRYRRDVANARAFLQADDKSEAERPFYRQVRAALVFIESHRELPRLSWPREVVDAVLTLEQAMVIWRQRHARMVERMIGRRVGTGGSGGVAYLDQTALRYRVFDDLWAVRTILLQQSVLPDLDHIDDYRLRIQD
ncbi:MAG: tryptophan 2,3-dioxygenase family protein, partial [Myxococcota bacterium]